MTLDKYKDYSNYLQKRRKLSFFYRNQILYPSLNKYLEGKTLDVGCGIGDFLSFKKNSVGVDINPELVEFCRGKGLEAKIMKVNSIPFQNSTFESVILDNVLEHISEPKPIINEIKRVLKKDKNLVVGVPGKSGYSRDKDHKVFYSKNDLINFMDKHNLKLEKIFGMPLNFSFIQNFMTQYCVYGIFKNHKK